MPIINAADAAAAAQAERDKWRREHLERLAWQLWGVETDIERLQVRRRALLEEIQALTGEGDK